MKKTIYIILTLIVLFPVTAQGQNTKAAPLAKSGTEQNSDTDKCGKIAEGGPTIEKLSRLEGAMSVRNLEFKYFDKFLLDFLKFGTKKIESSDSFLTKYQTKNNRESKTFFSGLLYFHHLKQEITIFDRKFCLNGAKKS